MNIPRTRDRGCGILQFFAPRNSDRWPHIFLLVLATAINTMFIDCAANKIMMEADCYTRSYPGPVKFLAHDSFSPEICQAFRTVPGRCCAGHCERSPKVSSSPVERSAGRPCLNKDALESRWKPEAFRADFSIARKSSAFRGCVSTVTFSS